MNASPPDFDWNQMRAFLATVESGSLSAAARRLNLTQPTLSRQIAALERDLGLMLFERIGRSLSLTGAGAELLAHVRAMGDAAGRVALAASRETQGIEGLVRITASDIVAISLLPPILSRLREIAPGIEVEVVASNGIDDLMRREADIAIRHVRSDQPDLIARRCPDTRAHFYAARSWLDSHGRPTGVEDLAGSTFIKLAGDEGLEAELAARGVPVTRGNFPISATSVVVCWAMVRQGLGIGAMIREVAEATPGVEMILPHLEPIAVPIWLVTHRELRTSRRIRLVFDTLVEAFAGERSGGSARPVLA